MEENQVMICNHGKLLSEPCDECGAKIPTELITVPKEILSYDMSQTVDPEIKLEQATKAAKLLKHAMLQKKKPFILNGEVFPEYEDWSLCASFFGCTAKIISDKYVTEYGAVGFEATAGVYRIRDGHEVGRAIAMCLMDEPKWSNKPLNAVRSMAQTRACAKALRLVFSWIIVLAGYRPTPAEEITSEMLDADKVPAKLQGIRQVD